MVLRLISAVVIAALVGPALASSCGDQIAVLDKRVTDEARAAISASTSGKYTASSREAQGITSSEGRPALPEAPPGMSAQAGKGGDLAQQAKVSLEQARAADKKGDTKGCEAGLARAKQQLDAAP